MNNSKSNPIWDMVDKGHASIGVSGRKKDVEARRQQEEARRLENTNKTIEDINKITETMRRNTAEFGGGHKKKRYCTNASRKLKKLRHNKHSRKLKSRYRR